VERWLEILVPSCRYRGLEVRISGRFNCGVWGDKEVEEVEDEE